MARSAVCTTSALICLLSVVTLVIASVIVLTIEKETGSPYGASTKWILYIQTVGVAVGSIAPMLRWYVVVSFKCLRAIPSRKDLKRTISNTTMKEFKIESYWTQTLEDWRDNFSRLQIWHSKLRKCLHNAKWFAITYFIWLQILTVTLSKLFIFISALLMTPFFLCFTRINNFMKHDDDQAEAQAQTAESNMMRGYVLLLDGELALPKGVLSDILGRANNTIEIGKKKQPYHLINLLEKFSDFKRVDQIPSPSSCWTLPVVTLTSIAIAIPSVAKHERKRLLCSVREGLSLSKLVDKIHDKDANIRKAADITWVDVVLYMKWLDIDLERLYLTSKSSKEVLHQLNSKAEVVVHDFKKRDPTVENPLNWPTKVTAANSMITISGKIMSLYEEEMDDQGLFDQISAMIADELAASLTSLPLVITTMCHRNAIEKREKSVRKAFLLLGKTETIVQLVQKKRPSVDDDDDCKPASAQDDSSANSTDEIKMIAPVSSSNEERLAITVDR